MGQLPSGVEGTAAGVLLYSFVCLLASLLVIWLTWHHRERSSHVAFLAYIALISTVCSVIQQIHNIIRWREIVTEQFENMMKNLGNPVLVISNSAVGMDLVLYYIQFYSYNAQALLVMFWAWALVQSVYGLSSKPKLKRPLELVNRAGIGISICFPVITISSLQAKAVQANSGAFILLAGLPLLLSIGLGGLALLLVFIRYIQSQRKFKRFGAGHDGPSNHSASTNHSNKRLSMYDRWLLIRFTIAFFVMAAFELTIVFFSATAESRLVNEVQKGSPDFSVEQAQITLRLFLPGVTPSLLMFIVFATTKPCLEYMRSCFCGGRRRQRLRRRGGGRDDDDDFSTTTSKLKISSPVLTPADSVVNWEIQRPQRSYSGPSIPLRSPSQHSYTGSMAPLRSLSQQSSQARCMHQPSPLQQNPPMPLRSPSQRSISSLASTQKPQSPYPGFHQPNNSYKAIARGDGEPYGTPAAARAFLETRHNKALPPTPEAREFLTSADVESGFASRTRPAGPRLRDWPMTRNEL